VYAASNKRSKWLVVGGTSAGAPQWASLVAIANQGRSLATKAALGGNQLLSALYTMPASAFYDVASGTSTGSPNYTATAGYDLATGLGSPHADTIAAQLLLV